MGESEADKRASVFARVLKALLRPLVKAMIAQGVTAPALYRLLKEVYVDVAESDFALDGKRPTDSRISVLTGVHRKDIRAMREQDAGEAAATGRKVSVIASVIGRWLASPETTFPNGQPRPLSRGGSDPANFETLVASVSTDVRARTILDELVRQDLVAIDEETDRVSLKAEGFLGPADFEQRAHFFAHNVGDHIAAATENLLAEEAPFMERAVFYNRLRPQSVDEIEAAARRLGGEALSEINRLGYARQSEDLETDTAMARFRFGVFFYRVDDEDTAPSNEKDRETDAKD